ncbi:MAG: ubiquitin-conjugating enzyme E2 [Isosphaerales bacterium]
MWRDRGKVKTLDTHRVEIKLGASYPRTMPEIRWITPIYHPNISEIGMVCLGGYGTHWVPSVQLDELCIMLWDMVRYHNYDIRSPYNRDAALWVASQAKFRFPTDGRSLRDLRAAYGRIPPSSTQEGPNTPPQGGANGAAKSSPTGRRETDHSTQIARVHQFIEALDRRHRRPIDFSPQVSRLRRIMERHGWFFTQGEVSGPNRLASNVGADLPVPEVLPLAMASADSSQARRDDEQSDVVLLEAVTTVQPDPEPPSPGADEIVFIE